MKMLMISYDSGFDSEILDLLEKSDIKCFSKWAKVQLKEECHQHLGSHIWPGFNSVIMASVEDEKLNLFLNAIKELKKKVGSEEIRAYIWPLEEII